MTRVAVIGAGPAGLWAARRAASRGHEVVVYERADHPGGMAASFEVGGVRVDHGSHRLHPTTDPAILAELQHLLGGTLQWRPRNGRILLHGKLVRFPLRVTDLVAHLPRSFAAAAFRDALTSPLRSPRADTYAEVVRAGLGPAMLEHFYGPYARKLWGEEPEHLSGDQARRRIAASTPGELVSRVLRREKPGFWYPERGFGAIVEALSRDVDVRLGTEVASLDDVDADVVWSTIAITALARIAGGPATALRFRALALVYLVLDGRPWTRFDAHYLPGPETPISRVSEVVNYRRWDGDPLERTVLCAELPCTVGDTHWSMDDDELGALAAHDLTAVGLPPVEPVEIAVRRIPSAYPIYDRRYELGLGELEAWLATRPDIVSFGRGGLFAHDNTHHALVEGDVAAACLRDDGTWDAAAWSAAKQRFAAHVVED